ncbi:hypothetical protein AVEN_259037-1 [Araneus ventricosus]|uniref:Uncharacterized protein n=1 Tax=Araneus ventricosus TaxID=182803 RepID=A0A4Y2BN64_ARAVE|nr:hypothetical protein AVEN_107668-1 [Araneus ventricosus]GBL93065.1 hypothetical protein AVEN_232959-1 [Araneus ventricosus]GBL93069.1 hypothetical protein AVEN_240852-1 [Araneus ventricosus]GBL93075.1 hypothetical protein AVEN_259037-1 [Araneus ventricosus]
MYPGVTGHKKENWHIGISEQTHVGESQLLITAISGNTDSVENLEHSPPLQHNASPDEQTRTTVMVSLPAIIGTNRVRTSLHTESHISYKPT